MKAKSIDRLEFTRKKFSKSTVISDSPPSDIDIHNLKTCPMCGSLSLRLDGGCMSCLSCGWSACG